MKLLSGRDTGRKRQMEERHKMVDKVQKLCIQYMFWSLFHNMVSFLYILLVRHMIKDSAKPIYIYISKLAKHSSSSFINICNSNYKVSTCAHFHRLRLTGDGPVKQSVIPRSHILFINTRGGKQRYCNFWIISKP